MNEIVRTQADTFREKLSIGLSSIKEACEIYVDILDNSPETADSFREELKNDIPAGLWKHLEGIGRKWVHPQLVFGNINHRNLIKTLPYSDQDKLLTSRVECLTEYGETLMVDLTTAPKEIVYQVIGDGRIRTPSEQRLYKEAQKEEPNTFKTTETPYIIKNHKLHVRSGVVFTKAELKKLIGAL